MLLLFGCSSPDVPALLTPVGMEYDTAQVTRDTVSVRQNFSSAVVPYVENLYFESEGAIAMSYITLGDEVKQGDILFELDIEDISEQIEDLEKEIAVNKTVNDFTIRRMELDVTIARTEYDKLLRLNAEAVAAASNAQASSSSSAIISSSSITSSISSAPSGISSLTSSSAVQSSSSSSTAPVLPVSDSELVLAQARINSASTALAQEIEEQALTAEHLSERLVKLRASLVTPTISAPFDGVVVYAKHFIAGDEVEAYTTIVSIADTKSLSLTGEFISSVSLSAAVKVTAAIDGKQYEIENVPLPSDEILALQLAEREIFTYFNFTEQHPELKEGQFAIIEVYSDIAENVLTIPPNAVNSNSTIGDYVFIVEEDGRLTSRPITVGISNDIKVEVTSGLEEGELVHVQR